MIVDSHAIIVGHVEVSGDLVVEGTQFVFEPMDGLPDDNEILKITGNVEENLIVKGNLYEYVDSTLLVRGTRTVLFVR